MEFWKTWKEIMLSSKSRSFLKMLAIILAVPGIPIIIISFAMGRGYGADAYATFIMGLLLIGAYLLILLFLWSIVLLILYLKQKEGEVKK